MSFRSGLKVALALRLEEFLAQSDRNGLLDFVTDAEGREHAGPGPGGGQFVPKGEEGGGAEQGDVPASKSGGSGGSPKDASGKVTNVGEVNGIKAVGKVGIEDWQVNHGISKDVMESREYQHYDRSGETPDGKMDPKIANAYGSDKSAMTQMRNASGQSSGIIMTRHAVPGSPTEEAKTILPQTRPDVPIVPAAALTNLRQVMQAEGIVPKGSTDREMFATLDANPELKDKVINGFTAEDGTKVPGFGAKYLFPAGDNNAARVDLPPNKDNVENFLHGTGRVYIAMEGTLKTDSVLTALIASGALKKGDCVIGVPSVTLWQSPEMKWVADNFLKGKDGNPGREVVLMPDADGVTNPMVINQARALEGLLEGRGAGHVIVATPPLINGDEIQHVTLPSGGEEKLKGVDDFLGAGRGSLDGLAYADRTVTIPSFQEGKMLDLAINKGGASKVTVLDQMQNALRAIALVAGPSGTVRLGSRSIGAAIGASHTTAQSMTERLQNMGLLKVEYLHDMGPKRIQELVDQAVLPRVKAADGSWKLNTEAEKITYNGHTFDLADELKSPVYTIVDPAQRAVDGPSGFVGDIRSGGEKVVRSADEASKYGQPIGSIIAGKGKK